MSREAKPLRWKDGVVKIEALAVPTSPTVYIDYLSALNRDGKRTFFATWGTPKMAAASETCEGSCCVNWQTGERMPLYTDGLRVRGHRPWQSQIFFTIPDPEVARWRSQGFEVHIHDYWKVSP